MPLLNRFRDLPVRRKLTILMLLSSGSGLVLAAVALIGYAWFNARAAAIQDLSTVAAIAADNASTALLFGDSQTATEALAGLRAKAEIDLACLYHDPATQTRALASYIRERGTACPAAAGKPGLTPGINSLTVVAPVTLKGEHLGLLRITQNLQPLQRALRVQIAITITIIGASFAISALIGWVMRNLISRPILRLAATARQVSESRDYKLRAPGSGGDEVGRLVQDFNQMLEQIELRDTDIQYARDDWARQVHETSRANHELEQTLQRLKEAQTQLVQSEKMASLGALVAGVAHEINTPVGVGVTAASTLQARAAQLRQQYQEGSLKRSELERFVAIASESTEIILKNLQRAADLIHSFKQVAVDQTSGERRLFGLKAYIEEVLLSLGPKLRKGGHSITVSCPGDITLNSYPGALAQIVTNFVSNSLTHAFEEGQHGHMYITVTQDEGWINLRYTDDGRGIPSEHLPQVFDPFFTTRRGSGGSGLGMHIVYNLVTQMLGGTIHLASESGRGAEFLVRFPAGSVKRPAA